MDRWFGARKKAFDVREKIEARIEKKLYGKDLLQAIIEDEGIYLEEVPADDPLLGGENDLYCQAIYEPDFGGTIYVNRDAPPEKYVIYVAHELGHHFLHTRIDFCLDDDTNPEKIILTVPYAEGKIATYNPYQIQEKEANIFASELLVPSPRLTIDFDNDVSIEEMCKVYHVSKHSIFAQLLNTVLQPAMDFTQIPETEKPFHWKSLDESQIVAACADSTPVVVDAGPGTGKTRTLIGRIQWLLEQGEAPESIIALTFSNKATDEVRSRLQVALPDQAHQVTISTFHAFGMELIRRYGHLANIDQDFKVLDSVDTETLIIENLDQLQIDHFADIYNPGRYISRSGFGGSILDFIARLKESLITYEKFSEYVGSLTPDNEYSPETTEKYKEISHIYGQYEKLKAERNELDFGDLILQSVNILRENPEQLAEFQSMYKHVLVDEFQDINVANGEMVKLLTPTGAGLWVVGDLRQSIYRWRGASPSYLSNFGESYSNARKYTLKVNYRSTPEIVNHLNNVTPALNLVTSNVNWEAFRDASSNSAVYRAVAGTVYNEHAGIISNMPRILDLGYEYNDIAVLCRTNRIAAAVAQSLRQAGIPVLYFGDFFERKEIKDLLAVVDFVSSRNGISLLRVLQILDVPFSQKIALELWHKVNDQDLSILEALRNEENLIDLNDRQKEVLNTLLDHISIYEYDSLANPWLIMAEFLFNHRTYLLNLRRNIQENIIQLLAIKYLLTLARSYSVRQPISTISNRAKSFLRYVRAQIDRDSENVDLSMIDQNINAVHIMTIHKSKGLEFPIVFVPKIDTITFPLSNKGKRYPNIPSEFLSEDELDGEEKEAKSCLFVAMSRAKDMLFLSYASKQNGGKNRNPSKYWHLLQSSQLIKQTWTSELELGTSTSVTNLPIQIPDILSVADMKALDDCPRKFYYRLLGLHVSDTGNEVYLKFHQVVANTINRVQQEISSGKVPDWATVQAWYIAKFDDDMPIDHAYTNWYRHNGERQLNFLYSDICSRLRQAGISYKEEMQGKIEGISFTVIIDELIFNNNETHAIYYRIGSQHSKSASSERQYLYQQGLSQNKHNNIKLYTHSTFDQVKEEWSPKRNNNLGKKLSQRLNSAQQQQFEIDPKEQYICASCGFLFICPKQTS